MRYPVLGYRITFSLKIVNPEFSVMNRTITAADAIDILVQLPSLVLMQCCRLVPLVVSSEYAIRFVYPDIGDIHSTVTFEMRH